jgi:beta-galactosidase
VCPLADNKIELSVSGNGRIAGVGNGNPQSFDSFQTNNVKLFYGKAMVILGSGFEKGEISLTATSGGLVKDLKVIRTE